MDSTQTGKGNVYRLEEWACVLHPPSEEDPDESFRTCTLDPETCIVGFVYGKEGVPNGSYFHTTPLTRATGRIVTTRSNNQYFLGEPDKSYLDWLVKQGVVLDRKHPFGS